MKEYTVKVNDNGDKFWYLNGERHREDGPAIEYANGAKIWFLNGERHREDGPAAERANGTKVWYLNGKYHREDGPAVEYADGDKEWWLNGKPLSEKDFKMRMANRATPTCNDREVVIDGKKYKLTLID
jgi:hypothetical protein